MQSSCFDSLLSHNGLEQFVQPLGFPGEVQCAESRAFVERNFRGSLPGFLSAFVGGRGLSTEEADELRRMIAEFEEKRND